MAYNILSGNVSDSNTTVNLTGAFSGAYVGDFDGDGADLINVSHVLQNNPGPTKIPYFYGNANPFGEYNLRGNNDFLFDDGTRTFTTKTGSFSDLILRELTPAVANPLKYLALTDAGVVVLTSSAGTGLTAGGPAQSLQFNSGSNELSGSDTLTFDFSSNTLTLTGTLNITGTINANQMNINVINKDVINLSASGDTKFGDTDDDTHQFTGSVLINGPLVLSRVTVSTATFNILSKHHFIAVQTTTINNASTMTLPSAATLRDGQSFVIKDEQGSANNFNIQISTVGSDTIDGQDNVFIESPYGAINLYTNGSDKFFIY